MFLLGHWRYEAYHHQWLVRWTLRPSLSEDNHRLLGWNWNVPSDMQSDEKNIFELHHLCIVWFLDTLLYTYFLTLFLLKIAPLPYVYWKFEIRSRPKASNSLVLHVFESLWIVSLRKKEVMVNRWLHTWFHFNRWFRSWLAVLVSLKPFFVYHTKWWFIQKAATNVITFW